MPNSQSSCLLARRSHSTHRASLKGHRMNRNVCKLSRRFLLQCALFDNALNSPKTGAQKNNIGFRLNHSSIHRHEVEGEEDVFVMLKTFLGVDAISSRWLRASLYRQVASLDVKTKKNCCASIPTDRRYFVIEKFSEAVWLFLEVRQQLSSRLKSGPIKQNLIRWVFVSLVWLLMAINWTWSRLQVSFSILTASFGATSTPTWNWIHKFDYRYVTKFISPSIRKPLCIHLHAREMEKFLLNQIEIVFYCLHRPIWKWSDGGLAEWCLCI